MLTTAKEKQIYSFTNENEIGSEESNYLVQDLTLKPYPGCVFKQTVN